MGAAALRINGGISLIMNKNVETKSPGKLAGALDFLAMADAGDYSSALSLSARLSAVPRISPKVAPESEEPYWAMASFSSAISSALIETEISRVLRSNWVTRAST